MGNLEHSADLEHDLVEEAKELLVWSEGEQEVVAHEERAERDQLHPLVRWLTPVHASWTRP